MASSSIPLSDFEHSPAAKFEAPGVKYAGTIVDIQQRTQTHLDGRVKTFEDGQPMPQYVIRIEQEDGTVVALFAKGGRPKSCSEGSGESMLSAIGTAVRAAGASSVDVGGKLAVAHTGLGEVRPGLNAMKLYAAKYQAPAPEQAASIAVDDIPF